ncbi:MAG: cyclodeaminase/cyclohydrolase family protein [Firmicutes bacterium]|nr:cyclodeaminase/cyclohydrolase family protein [Bacillota bacterium]
MRFRRVEMIEQSCTSWLADLASSKPAPGGGGASALVGAVGVSLGAMVGSLTIGKKKYMNVEEEMKELVERSNVLSLKLQSMVKADAEAFLPLSDAYRMPSATEEEKAAKDQAIQEALTGATEVPLNILILCADALDMIVEFQKKGSRLALSDAGCAAACCKAAMESAKLNVYINLKLMKDEEKVRRYQTKMDEAFIRGMALADQVYREVEGELRP